MIADLLLSQAVKLFLIARQADSYSPSTIAQYKWALDRFVSVGDKLIKDVTTDDIRLFLSYMQTDYKTGRKGSDKSPLGSTSLFHAWKAVRAFYKWVCPELGLPNPSARIPQPRYMSAMIVPFKQDELKAILKACDKTDASVKSEARNSFSRKRPTSDRDHAIILTLLDTGLRVSELCRLQMSDLDLSSGSIVVRPYGAGIKSRPREIPLGASSRKAITFFTLCSAIVREMNLFSSSTKAENLTGAMYFICSTKSASAPA